MLYMLYLLTVYNTYNSIYSKLKYTVDTRVAKTIICVPTFNIMEKLIFEDEN